VEADSSSGISIRNDSTRTAPTVAHRAAVVSREDTDAIAFHRRDPPDVMPPDDDGPNARASGRSTDMRPVSRDPKIAAMDAE
jgi:hypothetical protein